MNVLCFGYRKWALQIYYKLKDHLPDNTYTIISSEKIKDITSIVKSLNPDIILFYGWSDYIPDYIFTNWECLMLHPSCLPKYRGGSPIQNQIQDGITMSCVSIFKITSKVDAGSLYGQESLSLTGNLSEILKRMTDIGFRLTCKIFANDYELTEQDDAQATYCKRRKPSESEIDLQDLQHMSALALYDKVRMLNSDSYPRAFIRMSCGNKIFLERVSLAK